MIQNNNKSLLSTASISVTTSSSINDKVQNAFETRTNKDNNWFIISNVLEAEGNN